MLVKEFNTFYVIVDNEKEYIVKKEHCTLDLRTELSTDHYYF